MESLSKVFSDPFDQDLFSGSLAATFLDFDESFRIFPKLNKRYARYMAPENEYLWKRFYEEEFLCIEFPDHKRQEGESFYGFFRRSFQIFKHIRYLLRSIVTETNLRSNAGH